MGRSVPKARWTCPSTASPGEWLRMHKIKIKPKTPQHHWSDSENDFSSCCLSVGQWWADPRSSFCLMSYGWMCTGWLKVWHFPLQSQWIYYLPVVSNSADNLFNCDKSLGSDHHPLDMKSRFVRSAVTGREGAWLSGRQVCLRELNRKEDEYMWNSYSKGVRYLWCDEALHCSINHPVSGKQNVNQLQISPPFRHEINVVTRVPFIQLQWCLALQLSLALKPDFALSQLICDDIFMRTWYSLGSMSSVCALVLVLVFGRQGVALVASSRHFSANVILICTCLMLEVCSILCFQRNGV